MVIVVFFLLSIVACFPYYTTAAYDVMSLNSTLNIPVNASTSVLNQDTYRAFYFTFETQPQMVELFLPPDGDMAFLQAASITYGIPNRIKFIQRALQAPNSSSIYLCGAGFLARYNVTTPPPVSGVPQRSSFQIDKYFSLPGLLPAAEAFLIAGDFLFLLYVSFLFCSRAD